MSGTNFSDEYSGLFKKAVLLVAGILLVIVALGALIGFLMAPGCAAGRMEGTGDVVVGFRVGEIPEGAAQLFGKAAELIPGIGPIASYAIAGVGTLLAGGGGAAVIRRNAEKRAQQRAEQAKREADAAWDEAQRTADLAHARRDAAFDEGIIRAAAASPVSPAPVVAAAVPAAGAAPVVVAGQPANP